MVDNTLLSIALPTIGRSLGQRHDGPAVGDGGLLPHLRRPAADRRVGRRPVRPPARAAHRPRRLRPGQPGRRPGRPSIGQLIALRAALGCAAAAMAPVTMSLIFRLFDDEKLRMRSITVVMVVGHVRLRPRPPAGRDGPHPRQLAVAARRQRTHRPDRLDRRPRRRPGRPPRRPDVASASTCPAPRSPSPRSGSAATPSPAASSTAGSRPLTLACALGHRRRRRGLRPPRTPRGLAHDRPRDLPHRTRARRGDHPARRLGHDGQRHVRADPALPVRVRLEPDARRPREPAPDPHDDRWRRRSPSSWPPASATAWPASSGPRSWWARWSAWPGPSSTATWRSPS